eukprot:2932841-Prymnesium_polylepis.1
MPIDARCLQMPTSAVGCPLTHCQVTLDDARCHQMLSAAARYRLPPAAARSSAGCAPHLSLVCKRMSKT